MTYVPIVVPPTNQPPPSPRTRELAGLLTKVLDEYSKAHPATTKAEVRAAIRMAQMSAGPASTKAASIISLGLGLAVFAGFLGLYFARSGGGEVVDQPNLAMIIMAIIIFLGVVAALVAIKARS